GYIEQEKVASPLRRGNVYARIRMIILYDQSSAEAALVVGTSNKTESLLGYSTLFGDSAWAINPLGDLYKRQVRQLSRAMGVPDSILTKAPSADLWLGQTDEEELGMSYDEADRMLHLLVDRRDRPEQVVQKGFDETKVNAVVERLVRYQFKRVPGPIPKLSTRTLNVDWLYSRDWQT
ncbi:NAD(+) synthase, partial [bacterium]|nr:NAD(+) synthase [bacterium]